MFPTKVFFFLVVLSTQSFALPTGQPRQETSLDTPAVNAHDSAITTRDIQNSIGTIIKDKRDNQIDIEARAGNSRVRARPGWISGKGDEIKKIFNGGKRDVENDLLTRGFGDFIDKIGKAPGAAKKFKDKMGNRNKNKREIFNAREPATVTVPYPQSQSGRYANADGKYQNRWRRDFAETGIALEARAAGKLPAMPRKAGGAIKKIFGGGKRDVLENDHLTSRGFGDFIDKVGQAPGKMAKAKDAIRNRNKNKRDINEDAGSAKKANGGMHTRGLEIEARAGGAKAGAGGAKNGAGGAGGAKAGAGGAKAGAGGAGGAKAGAKGRAAAAAKKAGGGKKRDLEPEV